MAHWIYTLNWFIGCGLIAATLAIGDFVSTNLIVSVAAGGLAMMIIGAAGMILDQIKEMKSPFETLLRAGLGGMLAGMIGKNTISGVKSGAAQKYPVKGPRESYKRTTTRHI